MRASYHVKHCGNTSAYTELYSPKTVAEIKKQQKYNKKLPKVQKLTTNTHRTSNRSQVSNTIRVTMSPQYLWSTLC